MEIVSVGLSWVYSSHFFLRASEWHKFWLFLAVGPNASHKEIEERIRLDTHWCKLVETKELFKGNYLDLVPAEDLMVHIEGLIVLLLDLFFSALSSFDIWMVAGLEIFLDVIDWELSLALEVNSFVGFEYYLSSILAQLTFDRVDELVISDDTVFVGIEGFKNTLDVFRVNFKTEVLDAFCELKKVKSSWVVSIHHSESARERDQAPAATLQQLDSETLH